MVKDCLKSLFKLRLVLANSGSDIRVLDLQVPLVFLQQDSWILQICQSCQRLIVVGRTTEIGERDMVWLAEGEGTNWTGNINTSFTYNYMFGTIFL